LKRVLARLAVIAVAALAVACGQKGPPLAPLNLVPAAPANVSTKRVGGDVDIRFEVPLKNANGPGAVALDRIEVYAATVAPGAAGPANRYLLTSKYRVGTVPIKPPPVEGEAPPPDAEADKRPSAGERATFVETLTEDNLKPVFTTPAAPPASAASDAVTRAAAAIGAAIGAAVAGAAAEPAAARVPPVAPVKEPPAYAVRVYAIRGLTKGGRPGPVSTRVELPLVAPPPVPPAPAATSTETAILLTWIPPVAEGSVAFNVYKVGGADPINTAPVTEGKYERSGLEFGTEECFVLRSVQKVAGIDLESDLSPPSCVTPKDTFAPAVPKGLTAVAGTGTMNLSWDANTEADLAGYLVLRAEAPGDTLQPLTAAPITGTSYEDKTVTPGVRYVYAIVAVDKASPPNRSAESTRVEETAR
jgi:predicted small lipoprotein YifL